MRFTFALTLGLLIPFFIPLQNARAELAIRLGSVDGAAEIQVQNQGKARSAKSGEILKPGDRIETGKKVTVTLLNPDGSVLLVGREGKVEIQESRDAPSALKIESGTLRGIVSKIDRSDPVSPKKKFRLFVRTQSAVMGVRGTDFVINANSENDVAQLHTLEGTVEVAKTESVLVEKGGVPVRGGEAVTATPEKIEEPKVYDQERFAEEMKTSQPALHVPAPEPPVSDPSQEESIVPEPGQPLLKNTEECRDDHRRFCSGEKGPFRVGRCMVDHMDQLAPQCKLYLQAQRGRRLKACASEIKKFCPEARGNYGKCLVKKESELSPECKKALQRILKFRREAKE